MGRQTRAKLERRVGAALTVLLFMPPALAAGEILLARQGLTEYRIVVPNDGNAAVEYAAAELQAFLRR